MAKAGVFSVREGPVLWDNLRARVSGEDLRPYRPQRLYLFLLNTSDGMAIMSYGRAAARGAWAMAWKDYIDRAWMQKLQVAYLEPRDMADAESMRCGGCGGKVGAEALYRALDRLDIPSHPDVIAGVRSGEDAAVHRIADGRLEVQTVDFFRAFMDDPYLFGRIAALNALSDLYAMNARPFSALATATIPYAGTEVREELLFQLISGAADTFREHDVVLTGGHSSESPDVQLGFALTGYAEEAALFRKDKLKPGNRLVLTKPLGTGAIMRAHMLGQCDAGWYASALEGMLLSNRGAAEILADHGVVACTDVSGFGLAGHLMEMLRASRCLASLDLGAVPLYPGLEDLLDMGVQSTLHDDNAGAYSVVRSRFGEAPPWLYDPQTSGGLLAGVPAAHVKAVMEALGAAGCAAAVIGTIEPCAAGDEQIRASAV